jgi:hypothetical protein
MHDSGAQQVVCMRAESVALHTGRYTKMQSIGGHGGVGYTLEAQCGSGSSGWQCIGMCGSRDLGEWRTARGRQYIAVGDGSGMEW